MWLTKTELLIFKEVANNNNTLSSIYKSIKKNKTYVSELLNKLIKKGFIIKKNSHFILSNHLFSIKLKLLLSTAPKLIDVLSNSGIKLLLLFFQKLTVKDAAKKSGLKEITIYKFIQKARNFSILWKEDNKYFFNEKVWIELKNFLINYQDFYMNYDERIPVGSQIYYKTKDEIVFSCRQNLECATPTAFTAFQYYNLLIYSNDVYYYLPKRKLNKKDILFHTLKIVEKTKEFRHRLYLALFYYKYKKEFKDINHEILDNLNKIFKGEKIQGYPPLNEIKEKAKIYDINM
jgi:hypothetical protein